MENENLKEKIAVLFIQEKSIYNKLGCDCWDIIRDAKNFPGGKPVISHPPCRAWGRLYKLAKPSPGEKELAILAIKIVQENGGILEHPRNSKLFPTYIPLPGSKDKFGGYSISIDQFWFGHRCKKDTLLYIVGCDQKNLPPVPIRFDAITHVISTNKRNKKNKKCSGKKEVSKREREATPRALAEWLIKTAIMCGK